MRCQIPYLELFLQLHFSSCLGACRDPQDFEEGEIRAVDQDMRRRHAAHWGHNLALYRALGGQAPGALTALQAALRTADGSRYVCPHL